LLMIMVIVVMSVYQIMPELKMVTNIFVKKTYLLKIVTLHTQLKMELIPSNAWFAMKDILIITLIMNV